MYIYFYRRLYIIIILVILDIDIIYSIIFIGFTISKMKHVLDPGGCGAHDENNILIP